MSNSEGSEDFGSPLSQFSIDSLPCSGGRLDDELGTMTSSDDLNSDGEFIVLTHPLLDAGSLSTSSTSCRELDAELSSVFDSLSFASDEGVAPTKPGALREAGRKRGWSGDPSCASSSSASTPAVSYEEAAAFITQYLQSPVKEHAAQLALLQALIVELGVRSPDALDLPNSLTSARKLLKAEVHVNIKEYVATRDRGRLALQGILQPNKKALRRHIQKKGNRAPLKWVKKQGLQVLLVTC